MDNWGWTAVGAAMLWAVAGAQAADLANIGPQASAAQIIAAHGQTSGPVLRIVYETSPATGQIAIDIAPDTVAVKEFAADGKPLAVSLYDYRLKRQIHIDDTKHTFSNMSLYTMVDYGYVEYYNRRMIRGMLLSAGVGSSGDTSKLPLNMRDPYWAQQDFGMVDPTDGPVNIDREAMAHGGARFTVDHLEAARFVPSEQLLSPAEMKGFSRFLQRNVHLHPTVLSAIVASGKAPSTFAVLSVFGNEQKQRQWKLVSVERTNATYPLSPADRPELLLAEGQAKLSEPLRSLLPIMLDAVAGRYNGGPRSIASYRDALADALAKGDVLQHYTLDSEFFLQYGLGATGCANNTNPGDECAQMQDVFKKWMDDPTTRALLDTFSLEKKGDFKGAIAKRRAIRRDTLSNPYIFDTWIGNALTGDGDINGALQILPNPIKANPYVASFYKDIGDAFARDFLPVEEWTCYDLARALPGGDRAWTPANIAKFEKFLETKYPEFF